MLDNSVFPVVEPQWRRDLHDAVHSMPASQMLELSVKGFSRDGLARIDMPICKKTTYDGVHVLGGIVGVLADYAGVTAAASTRPVGWFATTVSFEIHNVAPAKGTALIAIGRAQHIGKTSGVSRVEVHAISAEQTKLVCVATTTCRLYERKSAP